jgi:hypothetical protein
MTAPTISATPKKALDQRATSRHDNAVAGVALASFRNGNAANAARVGFVSVA